MPETTKQIDFVIRAGRNIPNLAGALDHRSASEQIREIEMLVSGYCTIKGPDGIEREVLLDSPREEIAIDEKEREPEWLVSCTAREI